MSLVDTIFTDVSSPLAVHQRTISSADLIDWIVQHPTHYEFLTHQLRRDFSHTPTREEEQAAYRQQYTEFSNTPLVANQLFYIVARSWWSAWVQYIHSGAQSGFMHAKKPGRIDNSRLVEADGNRLRWDLSEKEYVIINELLWNMLYEWYGGGPVVSRRVVRSLNKTLELELHPLFLHVCLCLKDGTPGEEFDSILCTKVLIVEKVKTRLCQIAKKDPGRCRRRATRCC